MNHKETKQHSNRRMFHSVLGFALSLFGVRDHVREVSQAGGPISP